MFARNDFFIKECICRGLADWLAINFDIHFHSSANGLIAVDVHSGFISRDAESFCSGILLRIAHIDGRI